jgi:hypothetical protein
MAARQPHGPAGAPGPAPGPRVPAARRAGRVGHEHLGARSDRPPPPGVLRARRREEAERARAEQRREVKRAGARRYQPAGRGEHRQQLGQAQPPGEVVRVRRQRVEPAAHARPLVRRPGHEHAKAFGGKARHERGPVRQRPLARAPRRARVQGDDEAVRGEQRRDGGGHGGPRRQGGVRCERGGRERQGGGGEQRAREAHVELRLVQRRLAPGERLAHRAGGPVVPPPRGAHPHRHARPERAPRQRRAREDVQHGVRRRAAHHLGGVRGAAALPLEHLVHRARGSSTGRVYRRPRATTVAPACALSSPQRGSVSATSPSRSVRLTRMRGEGGRRTRRC